MTSSPTPGVVDPAAVERLLRIGGPEFVVEMIDLFLEHAPARTAAARDALEAGDMTALYRAAHSLKSTAANLGARSLQEIAAQVEALAADGDAEAAAPLLAKMAARCDDALSALAAERSRLSGH